MCISCLTFVTCLLLNVSFFFRPSALTETTKTKLNTFSVLSPRRMSLSRCCNAPSFLFTTKRNTPAGTKLRYEVDTSGILPITSEVFKMFPDVSVCVFLPPQLRILTFLIFFFFFRSTKVTTSLVCSLQDMPYSKSQYKKCAVIGNGGILKNSKCGKEIDSADFVFRYTYSSLYFSWEFFAAVPLPASRKNEAKASTSQ